MTGRTRLWRNVSLALLWAASVVLAADTNAANGQWTQEKAMEWYGEQVWPVGANFVPRTAINQLEMWQAETFDPNTIDQELNWAAAVGFNCMRVYLHDLLWQQDSAGFLERIGQYLTIAHKHGIKTVFVLFDSVWDPHPKLGPQRDPKPGVHNSGWVQGPHVDILKDPSRHGEVKKYLVGVMSRYKNDERILAWDLLNEPGNRAPAYWEHDPKNKVELCTIFLEKLFRWSREVNPDQPLTAGIWQAPGGRTDPVDPLDQLMLDNSDIITFHTYTPLKGMKRAVEWLQSFGRPVICTEYMARTAGSTFQEILPYLKEQNIGAINWGLVSGRSQTIYPWSSWTKPFTSEPDTWFHDVFRPNGTAYDETETGLIRSLTSQD